MDLEAVPELLRPTNRQRDLRNGAEWVPTYRDLSDALIPTDVRNFICEELDGTHSHLGLDKLSAYAVHKRYHICRGTIENWFRNYCSQKPQHL